MSEPTLSIIARLPVERWPEFRELRLLALQSDPEAFGQTYAAVSEYPADLWQGRLEMTQDGAAWIVFAEIGGRLVGMVGAFQSESDRDQLCATIWGVYVDPTVRGRGAGSAMLSTLLNDLVAAGLISATLAVNKEQSAAIRLYERHGFQIVGHETVTLGDGLPHDEYLMDTLLGSQAG